MIKRTYSLKKIWKTMKKYIKNDKILNILKEKYRGKYGKINRISQNFKHFYSEI